MQPEVATSQPEPLPPKPELYSRKQGKVCVGLVLFGSSEHLDNIISSLEAVRYFLDVELFIRWNSACDKEADPLANCGVPISVLPGENNVGFGKAHNLLMDKAFDSGAEYFLCLNPDGLLHPDFFRSLLRFVNSLPSPALVEALQFPREHPKPYDPLTGKTAWCSGACLLIPRRIYQDTGGFDEEIFMYCEDVDLSWRARALGYECFVCDNALFLHDVHERKPNYIIRIMLESARYLANKYGAWQFREEMERLLVVNGFYAESCYLPSLSKSGTSNYDTTIQEWRQLLSFAVPRW